ncbi:MAG: pyruvate kinase [Clostridia bacterium]|nr:pyruvate kinase [Clostridia bacterium]
MRKTKIVCTLGPASENEKAMIELFKSGMNVARLNFSHGSHESHKKTIELFRKVRDSLGLSAAILLDTKGPEIRTGLLENGKTELLEGQEIVLTNIEQIGNNKLVSFNYAGLNKLIKIGDTIKIDDGSIVLKVEAVNDTDISCRVNVGGILKDRKSINVPGVHLDMPYLSEKDKLDIIFAVENDVDYIAASFVRTKQDVIDLRKFINYHGGHRIKIISKIENSEGVEHFEEILEVSDGIMVARGDMGVEVEYEKLPGLQKRFIKTCYGAGKIVITATQMLESMVHSYNPTRAEITDVANAVFDGTSAVMLSGETAMGDHPARVVEVMSNIVRQAEADAQSMNMFANRLFVNENDTANAICDAACTTAKDLGAAAIIAVTKSGHTARRLSKFRPNEPIVASTPELKTYHQLSLSWGIHPVLAKNQQSEEALFLHALDCAKQIDIIKKGDTVVIVGGSPLNICGNTNTIKVMQAN